MISLVSKKTTPLFIEFHIKSIEENETVMFLWEDDYFKSILFSDVVSLRNNFTYYSSLNKDLSFFKNNISFKIISLRNYKCLFQHTFYNTEFIIGKKVNFISQNNPTGYGYAARNYIHQLLTNDFDVYWNVNKFYECSYSSNIEYERDVLNKIDKESDDNTYNSCIIHSIPEDWNKMIHKNISFQEKLIGSTVWETTKLNNKWINIINNSEIDELIVPSNFNFEIFKNSGVEKPINIWRYDIFPIDYSKLEDIKSMCDKFRLYINSKFTKNPEKIEEIIKNKTVYYNISQYSERKNIDQVIKTFCTKFTKDDKVCLFVKTYLQQFTPSQTEYLKYKFYSIIKNFNNPPDIIFCFEELNDIEIQSLHNTFDVYFTLNRGEGFGLCSYTAKKFGNKVICGKFGAEKEFLNNDDILIDYELIPTFNMHLFHNYYDDNNQMWASYNDDVVLKKLEYIPKKNPAQ